MISMSGQTYKGLTWHPHSKHCPQVPAAKIGDIQAGLNKEGGCLCVFKCAPPSTARLAKVLAQ